MSSLDPTSESPAQLIESVHVRHRTCADSDTVTDSQLAARAAATMCMHLHMGRSVQLQQVRMLGLRIILALTLSEIVPPAAVAVSAIVVVDDIVAAAHRGTPRPACHGAPLRCKTATALARDRSV